MKYLNLIKSLTAEFNYNNFQDGVLSPIFFGSAIYSLGIKRLLKSVIDYGPFSKPRQSKKRLVNPEEKMYLDLSLKFKQIWTLGTVTE